MIDPLVATIIVNKPAQGITGWTDISCDRSPGDGHIRKMEVFQTGRSQKLFSPNLTRIEMDNDPVRHLSHRRID